MGSVNESRQAKMIDEMRGFIKKVLLDPGIPAKCMEIGRRLKQQPNARRLMADEISATTTIRIPETLSEADELFLDVLLEVLEDEAALY